MQHPELSPNPQDLLSVEARVEDSIVATAVDVRMSVTSSSSVRSSEASRAIREVAEVLAALKVLGISEGQVEIQSATVAEGKGIFGRGSTACFALVARRVPADKIVGLLQAATELPHTTHDSTSWCFDVSDEAQEDLIRRASAKAWRRAKAAVEPLGVEISGVLRCDVCLDDLHAEGIMAKPMAAPMMSKARIVSSIEAETGIELVKRIRVGATAKVTFHLT